MLSKTLIVEKLDYLILDSRHHFPKSILTKVDYSHLSYVNSVAMTMTFLDTDNEEAILHFLVLEISLEDEVFAIYQVSKFSSSVRISLSLKKPTLSQLLDNKIKQELKILPPFLKEKMKVYFPDFKRLEKEEIKDKESAFSDIFFRRAETKGDILY